MIDAHLCSYFKSGPPLIAWFVMNDRKGVEFGDSMLCMKNKGFTATQKIKYGCKYFGDEQGDYYFFEPLYEIIPKKAPQKTIVNLSTCEAWIVVRLLLFFDLESIPHLILPHKQWGDDAPCANNSGNVDSCPLSCTKMGGFQVEFIEDWEISVRNENWENNSNQDEKTHEMDSRKNKNPKDFIRIDVFHSDLDVQLQVGFPDANREIEISSRGESPSLPLELHLYGCEFGIEDFKIMLPQDKHLLNWFDRVVLNKYAL